MKSFYSLVKIAPNSLSDDNLTVGIILSDDNGLRLKFSKTKKQISKSLVSVDNSLIDFIELEIDKKIKETNILIRESKNELFDLNHIISSNYFDYLFKYSNGILKFSQPNLIEGKISENEFLQLYKLFVDSEDVKIQNPNKGIDKIFFDKINTNLIEKVKEQVHINIKFDSKLIPAINSFDMDCIGLNGAFVGAKSLPFNQSKEFLLKTVNTYISVIAQLSISYDKKLSENKFFLIADEPKKKNSIEYKYWLQLYKNENLLKLIPSDESAMVADIIEERKAHKFLS
jgi:hypothetical protein